MEAAFRFIHRFANCSIPLTSPSLASLTEPAGFLHGILNNSPLLGSSPLEQAEVVNAFSTFRPPGTEAGLRALESHLALRSYAAGPRFTAADALCVFVLSPALSAVPLGVRAAQFPEVARWLSQCYAEAPGLLSAEGAPARVALPEAPALATLLQGVAGGGGGGGGGGAAASEAAAPQPAAAAEGGGKKPKAAKAPAPPPRSPQLSAPRSLKWTLAAARLWRPGRTPSLTSCGANAFPLARASRCGKLRADCAPTLRKRK